MATITPRTETVTTVTGVTLELSIREAALIHYMVRNVAGPRENSPREIAHRIDSAFRDAGMSPFGADINEFRNLVTGTLTAKRYPA